MSSSWEPVDLAKLMSEGIDYTDWGGWTLDPDYPSMDLGKDGNRYWVDFRRCCSSAGVLDVVCQIAGKVWASDAILAGLVRAFDAVLHPQRNLCSWGQPFTMTETQLQEQIAEFVRGAKTYPRSGTDAISD